ncbi:MAG TPA: DUF6401 family natural product biosynthesis protein [Streptosporangiaceae bacterium]|nr:DUF6401 family natural product biosynthesis protein [Streptosporangiaceae bacterium]
MGITRGRVPKSEHEVSVVAPYLAGQIGQATLDRLEGCAHPDLDQHVAAVNDTMLAIIGPREVETAELVGTLVRYASGFVDAAITGGWRPSAPGQPLDNESMRLAAVSQLVARYSAQQD